MYTSVLNNEPIRLIRPIIVMGMNTFRRCDHRNPWLPVFPDAVNHGITIWSLNNQRHSNGVVTMGGLRAPWRQLIHSKCEGGGNISDPLQTLGRQHYRQPRRWSIIEFCIGNFKLASDFNSASEAFFTHTGKALSMLLVISALTNPSKVTFAILGR